MLLPQYIYTLSVLRYKRLLRELPIKRQRHYVPFIILCHPRSGSTLLHTYLNSHPAIVSKGEKLIRDQRNRDGLPDSIYISKEVFDPQPTLIRAVGIKFFVDLVSYEGEQALVDELNRMEDLKIILLKRRNPLRMVLSDKIAQKTGQMSAWRSRHSLSLAERQVRLNPETCVSSLKSKAQQFTRAESAFISPQRLTVFYEDLVSQNTATLKRVQQFLEVPYRRLYTLLRQQNPEPLRELISNYDELERGLAGSEWAKFLE